MKNLVLFLLSSTAAAGVAVAGSSSSGAKAVAKAVAAQAVVYYADPSLPDDIACDKTGKLCVQTSILGCNLCHREVDQADGGFYVHPAAHCTPTAACANPPKPLPPPDQRRFVPGKPKPAKTATANTSLAKPSSASGKPASTASSRKP